MSGKDGLVFFNSFESDLDKEGFLKHLVEISSEIIIIIGLDGQIAGFSTNVLEVLGYRPEDLLGKSIDLFFVEGASFFNPIIEKLKSEKKIKDLNAIWKDRQGEEIIVSTSFSMLEKKGGKPPFAVIIARDITREKLAQREIREYIEQIKEYSVQMENSNFMKDLFADIIRHDLMGPITIIGNTLDLMDKQEGKISLIDRNVKKITSILEVAMRYSKLEYVEGIDFQIVSLKEIIKEAASQNKKFAISRDMEIRNFYDGEILISADSSLFEDALGNLISNAVKYSKENTNIDIRVDEMEGDVLIKVIDYGDGVPDEFKETIFERFERGKRLGVKGSGMGLAIVKRIVELHGGKVWVEDNLLEYIDEKGRTQRKKQGAVFVVELPKT